MRRTVDAVIVLHRLPPNGSDTPRRYVYITRVRWPMDRGIQRSESCFFVYLRSTILFSLATAHKKCWVRTRGSEREVVILSVWGGAEPDGRGQRIPT